MELTAEIVSIGKELLLGSIQNKNASFLAAGLTKLGIRVMRSIDIEDEVPLLVNVWKECFSRVDIVICSGGMGLTLDDGTKAAAAAFLKVGLIQSPEIAEFLQTKQEWSHLFQAYETVPQGAFVFINPVGLAPGLGFSLDQKLLILLPGVPREVEALWTQKIAPYLQEKIGNRLAIYRETIHLVLLAEERVDPFLRKVQQMFPLVEVGIYPQKGTLTLQFSSPHEGQIQQAVAQIRERFHGYQFFSKEGSIAEALQEEMSKQKKTLAVAESCTGGLISHLITAVSGSSSYFLGGLITYANSFKERILHVDQALLQQKGAVSPEVVKAMWEGLFLQSDADVGIAVSGVAGPSGGSRECPVGTVWFAIGERGKAPEVGSFFLPFSREVIQQVTAHWLLGLLYRKVKYSIPCFPVWEETL